MSAARSEEAPPGGAEEQTLPVNFGRTEEREEKTPREHRESSSILCDSLHSSIHLAENSLMMQALLCGHVCKVYRFQSEDGGRLLVREQMSETPLSFSLPRQLLSALTDEQQRRVRELMELGDLSPHLDTLRRDVTQHCEHLRGGYLETLEELNSLSDWCFKSSSSKSDRHLQFIPTNLHSQRMEVTSPPHPGVWYEVITFGAPADHHQAFKHGGLKRLMRKSDHTHWSVLFLSVSSSSVSPPPQSLLFLSVSSSSVFLFLSVSSSSVSPPPQSSSSSVSPLPQCLLLLCVSSSSVSPPPLCLLFLSVSSSSVSPPPQCLLFLSLPLPQCLLFLSVSYSLEEVLRAQEVLHAVARLQPQIFGNSEELLAVSLQEDAARLQEALDPLTQQTERFVHALKDELVKSALLDVHRSSPAPPDHLHSNGLQCESATANQQGRRDDEYDEEEWDRAWVNVTKSLNCIVVLADRLQGREDGPPLMTSSEPQEHRGERTVQNSAYSSWQEQLLPLVVTLRECVREAVAKARVAMTFVVLQGAVAATLDHGPVPLVMRRHAVFSQALAALVCGFTLKLYGGLDDPHFLHQLHSVGVLAQFEGLLSTFGDEVGMLEDMEVGVADLNNVAFRITESRRDQLDDLLPRLRGNWGAYVVEVPLPSENFGFLPAELRDGGLIRVQSVLFNIGINQQQSLAERFGDSSLQEKVNQQSEERLQSYCDAVREQLIGTAGVQSLPDLLSSLHRSVESRKRKNVEVLWIAAMICRAVNGVRLTSCKSAKDRTAMSVTLEQCALLRERHALGREHFGTALDCMRSDGCRMENVQKNVGSRKFAFSGVQLLTFPKLYRPPDGSYG